MPLDNGDFGYAAGIVDADGCIFIQRRRVSQNYTCHTLGVTISMAEKEVIDWFAANFGGSMHSREQRDSRIGTQRIHGYKRQWCWTAVSADAATLLVAVRPWLKGKAVQADLALAFRATAIPPGKRVPPVLFVQREAMYQKMRDLKRISA